MELVIECVLPDHRVYITGSLSFSERPCKFQYPNSTTGIIQFIESRLGLITGTSILHLDGERPVKYKTSTIKWILYFD